MIKKKILKYFEPLVWAIALFFLFFLDTSKDQRSLCIFKLLGIESCPGCGIGHAIHYALHFNFQQSFQSHVLGIPATLMLLYHIYKTIIPPKQTTIT